uniref:DUF642 domain-containing protein n=1 Tax=Lactuca sativa TaxID=4236 RepID=A0A9R1UF42_LACSA|nr:hypothetical protein LSAT_V11C900480540 [Lactuca sativa]
MRLWRECIILRLTINMRLQVGSPTNDLDETKSFVEWILKMSKCNIGGPNDGESQVEFSEDIIVRSTGDHIPSVVCTIYSYFENHIDDPSYFQDKAILVSTNENVDVINDYKLGLMKDEGKMYLSSNFVCETESADCFEESTYSPYAIPIIVCFAMTLNKSQRQSLLRVGLYLRKLIFTHVTLENSGFESPPTNLTTNSTSQFILLDPKTNRIPGWSFNGTVWYVTAGENVSLPGNGHGVQLGPNGMINQTFKQDGNYYYVLTFTLAPSSPDCANSTSVNVSGPTASEVFFFRESLGTEMWQTYAYSLWNQMGLMSLQIQSTSTNNGFANNGFEVGPAFIGNSSQGVLLEADSSYPESSIQSPLQHWSILGIVKYLDSKHYAVPRGGRAVELVSGISPLIVGTISII